MTDDKLLELATAFKALDCAIMLRRSGDDAVVELLVGDNRHVELIRERADGNFSHIIEPIGIAKAIREER